MSEMAERLRDARIRAGFETASDAARAFGWPASTYLGHENGDRKFSTDTAEKYARAFGTDWLWLIAGKGEKERNYMENVGRVSVPLVGLVEDGGYVEPKLNELYGHSKVFIELPLHTSHTLVAIEIKSDKNERYDKGDIVICRTGYDDADDFIDRQCLIETTDGIWWLRKISRGQEAGTVNLTTGGASEIQNVSVNQVGAIFLILPAAQVSPPHGFLERVRKFGDPREPVVTMSGLRTTR